MTPPNVQALIDALRPFSLLGCPKAWALAPYHDLPSDYVLLKNATDNGLPCITVGDVRNAHRAMIAYEAADKADPHPFCWVIAGDNARMNGYLDARIDRAGEFTKPLYEHPPVNPPAFDEGACRAEFEATVGCTFIDRTAKSAAWTGWFAARRPKEA